VTNADAAISVFVILAIDLLGVIVVEFEFEFADITICWSCLDLRIAAKL